MSSRLRVLVAGVGGMGASHALGYSRLPGYTVAGLVVQKNVERAKKLAADLKLSIPVYTDYYKAMAEVKPDVVSINTLVDTHAAYSIHAMRQGCHIFMEKPIAKTVAEAEEVARVVKETRRKLVIGYILRVHPAWKKFIELAQTLGKPLIMRMNLNQQSFGHEWEVHKSFIAEMPPLVDCGVHYVDVMCQMTRSVPRLVQGIAARVSDEVDPGKHNYGALQVVFEDSSVGWYEVGWGPMMSKSAFFVKDVIGPKGSVSIVARHAASAGRSSDVNAHTQTEALLVHHAALGPDGYFARADEIVEVNDEPNHDGLCRREQEYFVRAVRENMDLSAHWQGAHDSLRIVLAADQSAREGRTVQL